MATYNGQVTGGGLNLRASASTGANSLVQIPNNTQIVVSDYSGNTNWYCTTYSGKSGFVMKQYVNILGAVASRSSNVTGGGLNLRTYPSTSAPSPVQIPNGTSLTVQTHDSTWSSTTYNGNSGFVKTQYLTDGSSDVPTSPATGWRYGKVIATPNVNVRSSAPSGSLLGRWPTNRIAIVTDASTTGWYKTNWKGTTAYVSKTYVTDDGAASNSIPERMKKIADNEVGLAEPDAYTYYGINSGTAWCQLFANWLALHAGMSTSQVPSTASTPKGIEWHILNGNRFWFVNATHKAKMRQYSNNVSSNTVANLTAAEQSFVPVAGDFVYFRWNSQPSDHCSHVGYVYSVNSAAGTFVTVEGNITDKVVKRTWQLTDSQIIGYGRLQY